jgi:hypothetical protein
MHTKRAAPRQFRLLLLIDLVYPLFERDHMVSEFPIYYPGKHWQTPADPFGIATLGTFENENLYGWGPRGATYYMYDAPPKHLGVGSFVRARCASSSLRGRARSPAMSPLHQARNCARQMESLSRGSGVSASDISFPQSTRSAAHT